MSSCVRLFTWFVLVTSGYLLLYTVYDLLHITYRYITTSLYDTNTNYNYLVEDLYEPAEINYRNQIRFENLNEISTNKQNNVRNFLQNQSQENTLDSFVMKRKKLRKQSRKQKNVYANFSTEDTNIDNQNKQKQKIRNQIKNFQNNKYQNYSNNNVNFDDRIQKFQQNRAQIDSGRIFYVKDDNIKDCIQRKHLPGLQGKIIKSFVMARDPQKCKNIEYKNVKLIGVVATHHKAGTVMRKGFYFSICARSGINFIMLQDVPIKITQNNSFQFWENYNNNKTSNQNQNNRLFQIIEENNIEIKQINVNNVNFSINNDYNNDNNNIICKDYHPCNDRAIVHAKLTFRETCIELGVKCKKWYNILCFVEQCQNKLQINKNLKIINPIRNPINMIISAYLYHKGSSPENWAANLTLGQIGFLQPINGKNIQNISLSNALKKYNVKFGLEIAFRIMSNDLLDMTMLHIFSKKQKNIMSSKFEECMDTFEIAMKKELDFIGFYAPKISVREKKQIVQFGSWVTSEKNLQVQKRQKHITSDIYKEQVFQSLQSHARFGQLLKLAQLLGYENDFQK